MFLYLNILYRNSYLFQEIFGHFAKNTYMSPFQAGTGSGITKNTRSTINLKHCISMTHAHPAGAAKLLHVKAHRYCICYF